MELHRTKSFSIRDGLIAVYDQKEDSAITIFRVLRKTGDRYKVLAVAVISEHKQLGVNECYTEATITTEDTSIEDFRVLYEDLGFHLTWYKHYFDQKLEPYIICQTYFKIKYKTKKALLKEAKRLESLIKRWCKD